MKKIIFFVISLILGIVLFVWVLRYIGVDEIKSAFTSFPLQTVFIVIALGFGHMFIVIYRWMLILHAQGDMVRYRQLLAPKFIGFAISYLTPGLYIGGEPVRAYVLKKEAGVKFSHGLASIIVDKILDFTYPLPFLIGGLVYAIFTYNIAWGALGFFVLVLLGLIILLIFFYIQTYRGKGFFSALMVFLKLDRLKVVRRLYKKVQYFENLIITFFQKRRALFAKGLLLSLLAGSLIFFQFVVILNALGIGAGFFKIFVLMVFMILSFLIPIPGSLGSFEAGQVIVFKALNHPASVGVAFSLIIRVTELLKVAVGLIFLSSLGLKFLKNVPRNGNDEQDVSPSHDE